MRWFSLFQSRPGNDWTPVSNADDHDETGMDDLMRMSMGDYQEHESSEPSASNTRSSTTPGATDQPSDFLEPVFHQSPASGTSATRSTLQETFSHSLKNTLNVSCSCSLPKLVFPQRKWYLILLSLFVFIAFIGINVGLGVYSLAFYKPEQLVIDKSVKSFSIPNHEAYRHFEALMLARKNNASGRFRRSTDAVPHSTDSAMGKDNFVTKEREMLRQTKSALKNLNLDQKIFSNRNRKSLLPNLFSSLSSSDAEDDGSFEKTYRRFERSVTEVDCMHQYQSKTRWKMHVVYLAQGDNETNMFTSERLQTAHNIEHKIIEHPLFPSFCLRDQSVEKYDPSIQNMHGCVPPNSLLTYFFPSQDEQGTIYYDGMGKNLGDIDSALKLAMNHETFYYYVDEKINKTYQKSHLLRTEILFGAPLQGFPCVGDQTKKDQDDKFRNFVVTYINLLSKASTDKVQVLYGGNEIFDYEVTMSFWSDVRLAIISLVAIFLLMLVLSLSLFLTVVGVVIIALSFPISLFFYRVVFGIDALGILNGAAAFVIIGIGVDDVFVYINIYRQASHIEDEVKRIFYTFKTAGVATFFTSFTTAAAFAANLASAIPAVYEFGLFMSLVVSTCWISVFVLMPPALYLNACCFEPLERFLFSCISCVRLKDRASDESGILSYSQMQASDNRAYQDDDVPMLNIEGDDLLPCGDVNQSSDLYDEAMLLLDDPYIVSNEPQQLAFHSSLAINTSSPASTGVGEGELQDENKCLGRLIQQCIMFLTDRVVIRWRYVVIGFYLVALIASCALMAQLRPSTHPPQLFRPDTNLQQLLDLKANFSIIDTLQCDRCSAIYNLHLKTGSSSTKMNQGQTTSAPSGHNTERPVDTPHGGGATTQLHPQRFSGSTTQKQSSNTIDPRPHVRRTTPTAAPMTATPAQLPEPTTQNTRPPLTPTHNSADTTKAKVAISVRNNFNACMEQSCNDLKDRPLLESGATVFVVFGISGVDRSKEDLGHVLEQFKSSATFDPDFGDAFNFHTLNRTYLRELCLVCQLLSNNTNLVKPGSAQCIPGSLRYPPLQKLLKEIPECQSLPTSLSVYQRQEPAHAEGGLETKTGRLLWLAFAFESTTSEGQAYFEAYKQYEEWEKLMVHIRTNVLSPDSPLKSIYQTSEFWTKVMMEVVAVNSAIYGLVLSMIICVISVAVFTGHAVLLVIVVLTIIVMICGVVAIFYLAGWEMGAVEAVSLSILVGSSVDYCVHIVEGYILAGRRMTHQYMSEQVSIGLRQERTSHAVRHIGVAIVCSALTTIIAAIPLTQTFIQPFAKFGTILLINTTVSMVMTLTLAVALMAAIGPARYRSTWKSHLIATASVIVVTGAFVLALYIATSKGVVIPGPSGSPLFS
ncbi:unnamed protein product [Lymnaea stagnalis]|uniref:SSD domain-containing protein n=1 Tax=Lymnaea stagnalis TaxID=6523 RepID=A0AAV2HTF3_LYMST